MANLVVATSNKIQESKNRTIRYNNTSSLYRDYFSVYFDLLSCFDKITKYLKFFFNPRFSIEIRFYCTIGMGGRVEVYFQGMNKERATPVHIQYILKVPSKFSFSYYFIDIWDANHSNPPSQFRKPPICVLNKWQHIMMLSCRSINKIVWTTLH